MKIQFILHETFEGPGCIEDWIRQKGWHAASSRTYLHESYPETDCYDWLIIMGGSMSTWEEKKYPWLKAEKDFILKSIESGKIVLGICFGAQLIAEVLGGKVYQAKEEEIGWYPVNLFKTNFPLQLRTLEENPVVFHWHSDTFNLPLGAIHLASSQATKNQAFLYKDKILALQYHHEVNDKSIGHMLDSMGSQPEKGRFVQTPQEIIAGMKHINGNHQTMFRILDYLNSCK
jgi:GMP synthase (glutamine-hydrolysing)